MNCVLRNARFAIHSLWLCLFPILSVTVAVILLAKVPQGTEVLRAAFDDASGREYVLRVGALAAAMFGWSLANWYASRVLLARRFPADAPAPPGWFAQAWREWFPRLLPLVGLALLWWLVPALPSEGDAADYDHTLRTVIVGNAIAVALFTIARRRVVGSPRDPKQAYRELAPGDRLALWIALAFTLVLLDALAEANFGLSRFLGTPTLLFLALACVTLFGSVVLIYLPKSFGGPAFTLLPLIVFFACAQFELNHNHVLSDRPETRGPAPAADRRPTALEYFRSWDRSHGGNGPIVLVAAEGGASRSGWWTAHVLGTADAETGGAFTQRIFAISGVSGGSVGAAAFTALLARRTDAGAKPSANVPQFPSEAVCESNAGNAPDAPLPMQSACMLGRDVLAPLVGYMLFPDGVQRFWPFVHPEWDRSLGLELSWRRDWKGLFGSDTFGETLAHLYEPQPGAATTLRTDLPLLLLNTTRANMGWRTIQTVVRMSPDGDVVDDLRTQWPQSVRLPLTASVHNSARFPLASPAGEIYREAPNGGREYMDALMDGGYFENSGAHSLLKLLQAIERDYKADKTIDPGKDKEQLWNDIRRRLVVLFIENDPPAKNATAMQPDHPECYRREAETKPIKQEEIVTPLLGLYETRTARAQAARAELLDYIGKGLARPAVHEHVPLESKQIAASPPSMNWYMTTQSRRLMWNSLAAGSCARAALERAKQSVLGTRPAAKGGPA